MAADSTGKVTPGSPFRAPPARVWNNMIDAGQAFADGRLSSGPPGSTRPRETDLLKLKNSSGAVRRKGEILKIEGKVIESVTGENIWLDGIAPTTDCRFGILKTPADVDEVVTVQVSGVCMAMVNVTDASHTFASAAGANYVLRSGTSGPLEILFAPVGTGELECVVRFAGGGGGGKIDSLIGSTGCCCNCTDCVQPANAAISDCVACPSGATTQYKVRFVSGEGGTIAGRTISDIFDLTWSSGCIWLSDPFYVTVKGVTGRYQWELNQNGNSSTITLVWYDGGDPLHQTYPYPCVIRYVFTSGYNWSCRCNNQMTLADRECLPVGSGLACSICVIPLADGGCSGTPCASGTCVSRNTYWTMPLSVNGGDGCKYTQTLNLCCASGACLWEAYMAVCSMGAILNGRTGVLTVRSHCIYKGYPYIITATYSVAVIANCPFGTSITATFVSGDALVTWPATLALTPHDADDRVGPCKQPSNCCDGDCYWTVGSSGFGGTKQWISDTSINGFGSSDNCRLSSCPCTKPTTDPTTLGVGTKATTRCGSGGGAGGCAGSATWTWTSGAWVLTTTDCTVGPPCTTSCSAPAPSRAGAFESEAVVVTCTCNP